MDSLKPTSAPSKNKLSKTFHKVIRLKSASKTLSNSGFCLLIPQEHKPRPADAKPTQLQCFGRESCRDESMPPRTRPAAVEAFVAKLFATVSAAKAAYAELQTAQFPYNAEAIRAADEAVVRELKLLSELKHSFLNKRIDSSPPHVTILLAEIQEQQSLMKMYEITMKKMQGEIDAKEKVFYSLQNELNDAVSSNKALEKKLNSSGQFSVLETVKLSDSNPSSFGFVLHYAVRSVRSFVKVMIREMEASNWDIETAARAIEPDVDFPKANHRCFAFESFVCREMFDGFDSPNFSFPDQSNPSRFMFIDRFKKLKAVNAIHFLKKNPNSGFGKFARSKYLRLVHPKMETSFSGNLSQRKLINSGEFPETAFFSAFAEMAKRVWLLHCLAFSCDRKVEIFQVGRTCRFSEVYMESLNDDALAAADGGFRVAFNVVPGFKIGQAVIQSQVYLLPAATPAK